MEKLNQSIDWNRINAILLSHYTVGTSGEGADAYPPLLLYKCLLLKKWFRINSDPELEFQIHPVINLKALWRCPPASHQFHNLYKPSNFTFDF